MNRRYAALLLASLALGCNFGSTSGGPTDGGANADVTFSVSDLTASQTTEVFGTTVVGSSSAPVSVTITNTGTIASGMLATGLTGSDSTSFAIDTNTCEGVRLNATQHCDIQVHFAPQSAGAKEASLSIGAPGNLPLRIALSGSGAQSGALTVTPTMEDFGSVASGAASSAVAFTFTNTGTTPSPAVTTSLTGANATDFQIMADACSGMQLQPMGECIVSVVFAPASTGAKTAALAATAGGGTAAASLSGTAVAAAAFSVTPSPFDFGDILTGTPTAAQTFTVENTGGTVSDVPSVTVTGTNAADFAVSANTCTSALAAGATCTFNVVFTPSTASAESATVTVSGTTTASATDALTGTGLAPAAIGLSPGSEPFGGFVQGQVSPTTTFTLTNAGGVPTGPLSVSIVGTNAGQFQIESNTCANVKVAATTGTCTVGVRFAPTAGTVGPVQASLTVTGTPGGTAAASLTGTAIAPAKLTISPTPKNFGTWAWNVTSPAQVFTVTNAGGVATAALTASLGGTDPTDFALSANMCAGVKLGPGKTCVVSAAFSPQSDPLGSLSASLNVGDGTVSTSAALSAVSAKAAALSITAPTGFTGFNGVTLGASSSATFTVTNGGGVVSGKIAMSISGSSEYALVNDGCTGNTVQPTSTCTVGVVFSPMAKGPAPAQLNLTAAPGGPATYALTGTGLTPAALTISPPTGFVASNGFGSIDLGSHSGPFQFTLTNTGTQPAGVPAIASNNAQFAISANTCTGALTSSCTFDVTFTPVSPFGTDDVTLTATAAPGGTATYSNSGTGLEAVLSISPAAWDVQLTACGNLTQNFTVTNMGNAPTVGALSETLTGAQTELLSATVPACAGSALPAGMSCVFPVTFGCSGVGGEGIGTLDVTSGSAATSAPIDVAAGLVLNPNPATFGASVAPGKTATQTFTMTNYTGATTLAITGFSFSGGNPSEYTIASDGTCLNATLGTTSPSNSCTFDVTFSAPVGVAGPLPANLSVDCTMVCTFACTCTLATTVLEASVQ